MGKYSEAFVAFEVAMKKHAVAIAEGGREGEVRFLGDVENNPLPIEGTIKRLAERYSRLLRGRADGIRALSPGAGARA
jgi:transposase